MDWESMVGNCAQYEQRLREVERERLADRVWASARSSRPWWGARLLEWMTQWQIGTRLYKEPESRQMTMSASDQRKRYA